MIKETKEHFAILDGLRGVAAIAVVIFHFMEFVFPDYKDNFIAHAFLAVDFFFCLSGFVIAYAYDTRIRDIGFVSFIKLRLIRLHPLVIIGSILGLVTFIFDPFTTLYSKYSDQTLWMFITSCLMIPNPVVKERYFNLFHLNPPVWSLFWEYIANAVYALGLFKLKNRMLWIFLFIAAALLFMESAKSTYLGVGWGGDNFAGGGARVFYSFIVGILVYRSGWIIHNRLGFFALSVLLLIAFLLPYLETLNWIMDPLVVIFYFPVLVALGAGSCLHKSTVRICQFSGNISYPLYVVHYPFLWLFLSYIEKYKPPMNEMLMVTVGGLIALIGFAYGILVFVDQPVRKFLKLHCSFQQAK